jgi:serine/threonine protein kinase
MQTRIGKYVLKKKLGAGAHGSVYLALDEFSGREVALKFYEMGKSTGIPNFARSQFLTEAALAGRMWHPHIALIMDACSEDTMSYVVTEFFPGGSLSQFTGPRGLLPVSEVVEIGFKCSGVLDYAFRNNVIHRDIKPANILRTADTQVKISDFGVAFIRNAAHTQIMDAGSPYYASPEQATGAELSYQSDMFSLGVVLYEMLAGLRPFTGESSGQVLHRLVSVDPGPLSHVRPDLPGALGEIVMRALQKTRGDRYENWAEFALDLAKAGRLSKYDKTIPDSEKFTALKSRPMLAELDDAEIWEFGGAGLWSRLPSYTAVVREGESGDRQPAPAGGRRSQGHAAGPDPQCARDGRVVRRAAFHPRPSRTAPGDGRNHRRFGACRIPAGKTRGAQRARPAALRQGAPANARRSARAFERPYFAHGVTKKEERGKVRDLARRLGF